MADPHGHGEGPQQTAWQLTAPRLLILSLLFHLVFLRSIFDVYFTSPVVQVADRFSVMKDDGRGLAKRVMLFVGDGLRADKLFQTYPSPPFPSSDPLPPPIPPSPHTILPVSSSSDDERTTPAPFVRSLIQSGQAQWGVSHTRVPTESRPGHVALIGGMYEDVSAVTRGWTTNPVPFDSVLNQSSHAFTFGSPDILPMFALGASDPDRVATFSYDEDAEDFTSDAVHLDLWVLDRLSSLLVNASSDPELKAKLDAPGVVFFEHLLGLDTTGHSYRPHGAEYHRNIRVVDYVVSRTVKLLSEYYGDDGETAFVFTADHGMSSLGNHGDGHPDNTRTPLVVWGKGVRRKEDWEEPARHDDYSAGWGLKGVRRDVEQADIAVLMAVLAGVPIPANSAGRLPLEYLDASPSFRARAAFANAQQLLAEAEAKSELKRRHALSFRPFPELVDSPAHGYRSPSSHRREIQRLVDDGEYLKAEKRSVELGEIALRASNYFQKYDWLVLRTIVTTGYVSFMLLAAHSILSSSSATTSAPSRLAILPIVAFLAFSTRFAAERSPFSYYLYTFFPSLFTLLVLRDPYPLLSLCRSSDSNLPLTRRLAGTLSTLLILETMAYGYTSRRAFALIALAMGFVWPLTLDARWRSNNKVLVKGWMAVIGVLAVFPVLPVEKGEDLRVVSAGAAVVCGIGLVAIRSLGGAGSPTWTRTRRFLLAEIALTVACTAVTCSSALSLQRKDGLPALNQYAGWVVLVTSSFLPVFHGRPHGQPPLERLSVLLFAFGPAFTILSLSYEALFYACFCLALVTWLKVEASLARAKGKKEEDEGMGMEHVRISLFFLAFLHLGFFGCGNVASISSFYLEPVYRLMTVFAPFPMGALLLLKLLIPFVALSAVSSAINHHLRLPPLSLFLVSSILSEILTINFFFRVTDTGSWLEIGSSITNFVICSLLGLFSSALLAGGEGLLKGTAVGV